MVAVYSDQNLKGSQKSVSQPGRTLLSGRAFCPASAPILCWLLTSFFLSLQSAAVFAQSVDNRAAELQAKDARLEAHFQSEVAPFLKTYCLDCHGSITQEAMLDLSGFGSAKDVAEAHQMWEIVWHRIESGEMPPADSTAQPTIEQRTAVLQWIKAAREQEATRNAGDPGPVLARRLSNEEYNYSIRDLTGADIRPTASFPVDPANEAGFDNTGESLAMSPALLKKYLDAARDIVDHMMLTPTGIAFAPHPVVTDTDRDKYCVKRIVQFYQQQPTDLADYLYAAWLYQCREKTTPGSATLQDIAAAEQISPRYLQTVWSLLTNSQHHVGPVVWLQERWNALPQDKARTADVRDRCAQLRNDVNQLRSRVVPKFASLIIEGNHNGSQPFVLWKNRQHAAHRQLFDRNALIADSLNADSLNADTAEQKEADPAEQLLTVPAEAAERAKYEASFALFCAVIPDAFYISERGRDYVNDAQKQDGEKGRLLSAGFHSMMGYFRDDSPLYELVLSDSQREQLDSLWLELDVIASAPMRQYVGFLWFERTDSRFMRDEQFDFARAEDRNAQSEEMIKRLGEVYLEKATQHGGGLVELEAVSDFFREINDQIRRVEENRVDSEPLHIEAMLNFAQRAFRRVLSAAERQELVAFYESLRTVDGLNHEEAIQDVIVSVLMSPHFSYRLDLPASSVSAEPLTDYELASRLSCFLWSSIPDDRLLSLAANGELHRSDVLLAETRRMLQDDRIGRLAMEFGGNWLDFRRFEEHNAVDRERFPQFTDELRQAMFEEPVRFFVDLIQRDGDVGEFLNASHTFVNPELAKHYGIPHMTTDNTRWIHVANADEYGRGGLLPMAVFLTKNAPGLRTSPVKRGYWVVRRLLGERIPPPPPNVPELPDDEASLGELTLRETLARHREHKSCSGCHNRIDSLGLVFEGFGPVGERREMDLGGHPVDTSAVFPDGQQSAGLDDLRTYLHERRESEFSDNLARKLLSYGLGRSLILSDELLLRELQTKMAAQNNRFGCLVEGIVTSPQFLMKRGTSAGIPVQSQVEER